MEISSQLDYWKLWEEEKRMVYGALVNGKTRKGKKEKVRSRVTGRYGSFETGYMERREWDKERQEWYEKERAIELNHLFGEGKVNEWWVNELRTMEWNGKERLEVINDCTNPSYSSLQSVSSHDLPFIWNSREMEVKSREPCNLQKIKEKTRKRRKENDCRQK